MSKRKVYYAELEPDARGYRTYLRVIKVGDEIVEVKLDAYNYNHPTYGYKKSKCEKYNNDMHAESGTYYRDARAILEKSILDGDDPLVKVKGARVLSSDAVELLKKLKEVK